MDASMLSRDLIRSRMVGEVIGRDHRDYDRLRRVWNALADRRPAAIVQARSVGDVQKTIAVAAEHEALLAVRGGGHSIPGLSTCDDGIVLVLSALNEVTLDPSTARVEVLGGALLGDVDAAAVPAGMVVPAGVVSHTGVAGLTLGGGMGWLSRRFGLTIDHLLAADIVTADGQIRRIGAEAEPDLFWAIRGGGGNFGVVTKFTFRARRLGRVLIGEWLYPPSEAGGVLERYCEMAAQAARCMTTGFTLSTAGLRLTALWSGEEEPPREALEPFGRLGRPESGSLGDMTFLDLQRRSDEALAWNRRYYSKGGYLARVDDRATGCMLDCMATAPGPDCDVYVLQLGGAVADIDEEATAYTGRAAGFYWIVSSGWAAKADDARMIAWSKMSAGRLAGISMRGNYVNEQGDFGKEIAVSAYGQGKYDRLARLKARYDPGNLFRLNQNIEPKL